MTATGKWVKYVEMLFYSLIAVLMVVTKTNVFPDHSYLYKLLNTGTAAVLFHYLGGRNEEIRCFSSK